MPIATDPVDFMYQNRNLYFRTHPFRAVAVCFIALVIFGQTTRVQGQTAEEHASHHPGTVAPVGGGTTAMPAGGMGPPAGVGPPGGMPDMAKMMEGMGKTQQKEIFPTMMGMPEVTPETKTVLEARSREQLATGMEQISS